MIAEPFYLVTRRVNAEMPGRVRARLVTNIRTNASKHAVKLSERGLHTVVYECKIVEVHHASKEARSKRKLRKERQRRRAALKHPTCL